MFPDPRCFKMFLNASKTLRNGSKMLQNDLKTHQNGPNLEPFWSTWIYFGAFSRHFLAFCSVAEHFGLHFEVFRSMLGTLLRMLEHFWIFCDAFGSILTPFCCILDTFWSIFEHFAAFWMHFDAFSVQIAQKHIK